MKKIYLSLLIALISVAGIAQCSLDVSYTQNNNTVNVNAFGVGAEEPAYVIDWGDGTNSYSPNASHIYEEDGSFLVCVVFLDQANTSCYQAECQLFLIGGNGCGAFFDETISALSVGVDSYGTGGTNGQFSINWGDGSAASTGANVFHQYASDGDYEICLTYTSSACSTEYCKTVSVTATPACTVDVTFAANGTTVNFIAVGNGAANPTYTVDWGEGGGITFVPSGQASYTYAAPGTYTISVFYIDQSNFDCIAYEIQEVILAPISVESLSLNSSLSVYPNPIDNNATIELSLKNQDYTVVELLNLVGEKVATISATQLPIGTSQINWNTSDIAAGIYFIQVTAGVERHTIKVIKE